MIVEIEVQPETAALLADAQMRGVSLDIVLRSLLANGTHSPARATPAEWEAWVASHDYITAPPLSDEAISRDSIYTREDEML